MAINHPNAGRPRGKPEPIRFLSYAWPRQALEGSIMVLSELSDAYGVAVELQLAGMRL